MHQGNASAGIYLLGAGGHGKVVAAAAEAAGLAIAGFLDDTLPGQRVLDVPVLGPFSLLDTLGAVQAVVCIGDNRVRLQLQARWPQVRWTTIVHPSAWVHRSATLGPGTVVLAGAVVNPDARIGEACIINTGARVEHDCVLDRGVHLATGVSLGGRVQAGEGALLGTGSCARPDARIGAWAVVGAGAAVVRDIPGGVTVAGVPARPLPTAND